MTGCFSNTDFEDQYYERQLDTHLEQEWYDNLTEEEKLVLEEWTDMEEAAREDYLDSKCDEYLGKN